MVMTVGSSNEVTTSMFEHSRSISSAMIVPKPARYGILFVVSMSCMMIGS
jgi:hypothetical protein